MQAYQFIAACAPWQEMEEKGLRSVVHSYSVACIVPTLHTYSNQAHHKDKNPFKWSCSTHTHTRTLTGHARIKVIIMPKIHVSSCWLIINHKSLGPHTWQRHTKSASTASTSTSFPFPSSPHCPPITTVTPLLIIMLEVTPAADENTYSEHTGRQHWYTATHTRSPDHVTSSYILLSGYRLRVKR